MGLGLSDSRTLVATARRRGLGGAIFLDLGGSVRTLGASGTAGDGSLAEVRTSWFC